MPRRPLLLPSRRLRSTLLRHPHHQSLSSSAAASSSSSDDTSGVSSASSTSTLVLAKERLALASIPTTAITPQHHAMKLLWSTLKRQQQQQVSAVATVGGSIIHNKNLPLSEAMISHVRVPATTTAASSYYAYTQSTFSSEQALLLDQHPLWSYLKELNQLGAQTVLWTDQQQQQQQQQQHRRGEDEEDNHSCWSLSTSTTASANDHPFNHSYHAEEHNTEIPPEEPCNSPTPRIMQHEEEQETEPHYSTIPEQIAFDEALERSDTEEALRILQGLQRSLTNSNSKHTPVLLSVSSLRKLFWCLSEAGPEQPNVYLVYHALQTFLFKAQYEQEHELGQPIDNANKLDPYVAEYQQLIGLLSKLEARNHGGLEAIERMVRRLLYDIHNCFSPEHERTLLPIMVLQLLQINKMPTLRSKCYKLYQYMERNDFPEIHSLPYLRKLLDQAEYSKRDNLPFREILLRTVDLALEQYERENNNQASSPAHDESFSTNKQHHWHRYPPYIPPPHIVGRVLELHFPYAQVSHTHRILVAIQRLEETIPNYKVSLDIATLELIGSMAAQREWHETIFLLWQLCPSHPTNNSLSLPIGLYEDSLLALAQNEEHYPHLFAGFAGLEQHYTPTRALVMSLSGQFRKSELLSLAAVSAFLNMADVEMQYWEQQHSTHTSTSENTIMHFDLSELDGVESDGDLEELNGLKSGNLPNDTSNDAVPHHHASSPPPSVSIYLFNAVLSGVAERGDIVSVEKLKRWLDSQARARSAFQNMPGILPNADTFSFILSAQGKHLVHKLRSLKLSLDNGRMDFHEFSKKKDYFIQATMTRAEACLTEMENLEIEPSSHVIREYVEMLCTVDDLETATNLVLDHMEKGKHERSQGMINSKTIYRVARANFDAGEYRLAQRIAKHCSKHLIALHHRIKIALKAERESFADGTNERSKSNFWNGGDKN